MFKRHLSFSISYILVACLVVFTEIMNIQEIRIMVKPLICILLMGYLVTRTRLYGTFSKLIFFGLLFSLAGDVALLFSASVSSLFMVGLAAFLLAHVSYSAAFFRDYKYNTQASGKYGKLMLIIMLVFATGFFLSIMQYLGDLAIPVFVYMIVISTMAILAGFRFERVNSSSFQMILTGAVFFIISDSLLAVNKFVSPFLYSGVLIMITYMAAQYLITIGALDRVVPVRKEKSKI